MHQPETVSSTSTSLVTISDRVLSIDLLRAITMVLMIFVNDLWSLTDIPAWLEHVPQGADGIGLADTIFPAFLFIVGMSLPYAIEARRKKGATVTALIGHVVGRSIALLVMGVFLVNGESINEAASGIQRAGWNTLSCLSFILIWGVYPKSASSWFVGASKGAGIICLLILAFLYQGGDVTLIRFGTHWWGILGLIGWSYLAAALITIFARNRLSGLFLAWIGFALLSMADQAGLVPAAVNFIPDAIRGGTLVGLAMGGVVVATLFQGYRQRGDTKRMTIVFVLLSVLLIGLSVGTRPFWGLSKLDATPAWLFLCSAFTLLAFTALYWLADIRKKATWFSAIKPAGTDTLLCYLLPYFAYALMTLLPFHLPKALLTGGVGLLKSLLFAIFCAWTTGLLNRAGIRLKL